MNSRWDWIRDIKGRVVPKVIIVCATLALVWYVVLGLHTDMVFVLEHGRLMWDFDVYVSAFQRAIQHDDPYSIRTMGIAYLYPPPALLFIAPFAAVSAGYWRVAVVFTANLLMLALMLWGIAARYRYRLEQVWWWFPLAFGFAPFAELLYVGQINLITAFGIFLTWLYSATLPLASGFGLAMATVTKVTPLVYFLYLLLKRDWRAIAWGIGWLIVLFGVAILLFGWEPMDTFPEVIGSLAGFFSAEGNSQALVSILHFVGWMEQSAWPEVQRALLLYIAAVFVISGIAAWIANEWEPFFIIVALGTAISPNHMWYHHYVFILLPIFVWLAWSRLHPAVIAWCLIGMSLIQVDRYSWMMGLSSHVFAHSSILAILVWQVARVQHAARDRKLLLATSAMLLTALALWGLWNARNSNENLFRARAWIDANLRPGARIAREPYAPHLNRERYVVEDFADLLAHSPEWYAQNGYEYLVTTYGSHARFFGIAGLFPRLSKQQEDFFSQFALTGRVTEGDYEVRIYKTAAILPQQRVAARLGLYPAWLEFVGYDQSAPGEFALFWRTLVTRREKMTLTARVIDDANREIAHSTGDLFGDVYPEGRWQPGVVRVPWRIALPENVAPGMYRIQLEVEGQVAGRVPVIDAELAPIADKLFIGPFKIAPTPPTRAELDAARRVGARFGDAFALVGYTLANGAPRAGESLNVTVYWQSIAKSDKDYTVFVHLLDSEGKLRAQLDTQPRGGAYPTTIWDAGEIVRDDYALALPRDLAPGEYRIAIGLYAYPSLARLPVWDARGQSAGDHVILADVVPVSK